MTDKRLEKLEKDYREGWIDGYNSALDQISVYIPNLLQELKKKGKEK